jgi:uncharacterized protein
MDHQNIIRKAIGAVRPVFRLHWHHGAHGIAHWSRVWYHGKRVAQSLDVNPAILAWFAFLHDSQRHNEYRDPLHGKRAADFALKLRDNGNLTELSPTELEYLCEAMRLHSDGYTVAEPAICACWDADRLDLARVGITPDPKLLCTIYAKDPKTLGRAVDLARGVRARTRTLQMHST